MLSALLGGTVYESRGACVVEEVWSLEDGLCEEGPRAVSRRDRAKFATETKTKTNQDALNEQIGRAHV